MSIYTHHRGPTTRLSDSRRLPLNPDLALIIEGKKFMWDGSVFDTHDETLRQAEGYEKENFEVRTLEEDEKFLVYTRRVVKELVVTGT
jgi:hypothetical protein